MNEKHKKYFLGTLSQAEIEEIELRLISDASFEDELIYAKENLMEDFLDEMLTAEEAENFRKNFLNTPERVNDLKILSELKKYARGKTTEIVEGEQAEKSAESFFEKINQFFALNLRPIAVAAVFLIAIFAGYLFLFSDKNELAVLNEGKTFENVEEFRNFTNLNLISGTLRSSDKIPEIARENLTDLVFLRLALNFPGENFDVKIIENEKTVVTNLRAPAYSNQSGREIRLLLPASVLNPGVYQIEIYPLEISDKKAVYSFAVK